MFIDISISNVLCTASRRSAGQSVHLAADHVIKSFTAFSGDQVSSGRVSAVILYSHISDSAASHALRCWVSVYNFRAASCCFIREGLASRHIRRVYEFNSHGVTDDSETHYRGITALFS